MTDRLLWLAAAGLTGFSLTALLTPIVRTFAVRYGLISKPVEDRWGRRVVARLGGVAMFLGLAGGMLLWLGSDPRALGLLAGIGLVFAIGLLDDLRRIRPYTKLLLQLAVGSAMVLFGIRIDLIASSWLAIPITIFWFVFVMNAFNLLDNMDGLAAGVGAIASAFCVAHAILGGQWLVAGAGTLLAGVCLGFLVHNFPPAKIYMGDSGSHLLGASLAALALLDSWHQSTQLLSILFVPMLVLAVPIFDMCFVTLQRLLHGRHPFQGGTDHVSHRLVILGLSERQTVLALYVLSGFLGAISLLSVTGGQLSALTIWLVALAGLLLISGYLARVHVYAVQRQPMAEPASTDGGMTLIETMLLHKRRLLEVLIDFAVICSAYVGAHLLRFESGLVESQQRLLAESMPIILMVQLAGFAVSGLYRGLWRYIGIADLATIARGATFGTVFSALAVLYLWRFEGFSRSVFIIDWLLVFLGISGARVGERLFNEWLARLAHGVPIVIVGAGDLGVLMLRQLRHERVRHQVVGFLDDNPAKLGRRIQGVPVIGTRSRLPSLIAERRIDEVFIAMVEPPQPLIDYVRRHCDAAAVRWQVVRPPVTVDS